ncbi:hypothetical protein [Streptomyces sp. NPDC093093]|uniref:hypothetical protein n=1 Tax=Streptomyces sp. NPDC093093 TaxID=3366025 RepID=UPI00382EDE80
MRSVRPEIAEMLRDGLTNVQIARHLHAGPKTVAAARAALGMPPSKTGRPPEPSIAGSLAARSRDVGDGHREWTGAVNRGCPVMRIHGVRTTAYRAAWISVHGRPPVGYVAPGCGRPRCVAPAHMDDQLAREHHRRTYNAVFGGSR